MQKQHNRVRWSSWNQSCSGLIRVILIVLSTACLACLFPFPWGQFSELSQLMSWLQSGHNVVNFFHLVWVSVSIRQLTGYCSEYSIALEEELKVLDCASWLNFYCLVSFDSFPLFLHFLPPVIKLILWLKFFHGKGRQKTCGEDPAPFHYENENILMQLWYNEPCFGKSM